MKPVRMIRSFMTVGGWTLASRVLGFVRDILLAAFLGAGPVAEAFVVAFSLPNMFRRFFAEGAFNMAFIPLFSKKLEGGENPKEFAEQALSLLMAVLAVFTLVSMACMPLLVYAMASGFAGDERFDLAVDYGRVAFPYIFFISIAALLSGVLNSTGKFAAAAAAPVLLNVVLSAAMYGAWRAGYDVGDALVWGVPVAGALQAGMLWVAAARAGFALRPRLPRVSPEMKRLMRIAAPAALAGGVVQVNLLVGRQVASFFEGSIQYLNLADRLYQLPLGVVAIAIGVVLLPELSRRLRNADDTGGRYAFNRATEFALFLTVPSAVALLVIPETLIATLFQRGRFTAADAEATAMAVALYGLGLPAFVMQKVLQPLYYAREDTRRPFNYAVVAMVVNVVLAIGLAFVIGYLAAALATTLAGWVMMWQLWRGSRDMGDAARLDDRLRRRIPRIVISSAGLAVALLAGRAALDPLFTGWSRPGSLALLILWGTGVYFVISHLLGAFRLSDLRSATNRGKL
ncbi:murein biosynthesis integral membrane protein MurJ [Pseudooceanicola sp. C21-150M6]|uniref:murein biosynthesis integral membrane protein MurJ n=1 Tax=Pseudooceanicola sp. C21-150M6 TaxID=3434355 RepID=UPI003D7F7CD2